MRIVRPGLVATTQVAHKKTKNRKKEDRALDAGAEGKKRKKRQRTKGRPQTTPATSGGKGGTKLRARSHTC